MPLLPPKQQRQSTESKYEDIVRFRNNVRVPYTYNFRAETDDISWPPGAQQQTRHMPLLRSIDGTDRQMDGRTDGRSTVS